MSKHFYLACRIAFAGLCLLQAAAIFDFPIWLSLAAFLLAAVSLVVIYREHRALDAHVADVSEALRKYASGSYEPKVGDETQLLSGPLNALGKRLKHFEQLRSDFVADVSHELKTPVTSIKGFVETLLDGALDSPEDSLRFLKIIEKQTNRLTQIIDDLLMLSQLESGHFASNSIMEELDLCAVVQDVVEVFLSTSETARERVTVNLKDQSQALANRGLLELAFSNLLGNAIKYSGSDQPVRVEVSRRGNSGIVEVIDSGPGIAEEHLPRLFERSYRVDKTRVRPRGGTGLGLAIVKHVAEIHRGACSVSSQVGIGSRFSISLPLCSQTATLHRK